jgi:hypothetical protein
MKRTQFEHRLLKVNWLGHHKNKTMLDGRECKLCRSETSTSALNRLTIFSACGLCQECFRWEVNWHVHERNPKFVLLFAREEAKEAWESINKPPHHLEFNPDNYQLRPDTLHPFALIIPIEHTEEISISSRAGDPRFGKIIGSVSKHASYPDKEKFYKEMLKTFQETDLDELESEIVLYSMKAASVRRNY